MAISWLGWPTKKKGSIPARLLPSDFFFFRMFNNRDQGDRVDPQLQFPLRPVSALVWRGVTEQWG